MVTIATPSSISAVNSRLMIIASAELLTIISSKARKRTSSAMSSATADDRIALLALARFAQALVDLEHEGVEMGAALGLDVDLVEARSISIDLPRPTPPHR